MQQAYNRRVKISEPLTIEAITNPIDVNNVNITTVDDIVNVQEINNVTSVDLVDAVTNVSNVNSVDQVDLVVAVNQVQQVNTVAECDVVLSVSNVVSVDLVDAVTEVNNVTSVDTVDAITEVANVTSVDLVDEVTNVANVDFVPDPSLELLVGNYPQATAINLYARMSTSAGDWSTFIPDGEGTIIPLIPASSTALAISASIDAGADDTTSILIISYYATDVATSISTQTVTLNGVNKVSLSSNVYRIVDIRLDASSPVPTNQSEVYVYNNSLTPAGTGIPTSWYDYIRLSPGTSMTDTGYANKREVGIYYSPPNADTYIRAWNVTATNQSNECAIAFRVINQDDLIEQTIFYAGPGFNTYSNYQFQIPAGSTLMVLGQRINGTDPFDLAINLDMAQYI